LWYNGGMSDSNIHEFIKARPHLIWYTKNYSGLNEEAIVEATLNYGDWDDVQTLTKIIGMGKTAEIFKRETSSERSNYFPSIKNYFTLYFAKYAR